MIKWFIPLVVIVSVAFLIIHYSQFTKFTQDDSYTGYRRSILISGNDPITQTPYGAVLPGVSYFNKIYNMLDGTDLLEKSGRDIYNFRYSNNIQTVGSQYSYFVPVEFAAIPNLFPQCNKDTTLSTMKNTWSSSTIRETSASKKSGFSITLGQVAVLLSKYFPAATTIAEIASDDLFKSMKSSIENGNSRNTKNTRIKTGEGFEKTFTVSAETSLYDAVIVWDQLINFDMKLDFTAAINQLESSASNVNILDFTGKWGTHVIRRARMGAMCEESVYLKSSKSGYDYTNFYTHTQTQKNNILFWSSSSTDTSTITRTGVYNDELFYQFTNIRCEGECPTSQLCGHMTGNAYYLKPVEYDLIPIWSIYGLMSGVLSDKFQLFVANVMKALLECRLNICNNHGICTLRDDIFTSQFIYSWDANTFDDMIDYKRACYCDHKYVGYYCGESGYVSMNCSTIVHSFPSFLHNFKNVVTTCVPGASITQVTGIYADTQIAENGGETIQCPENTAIMYTDVTSNVFEQVCGALKGIKTNDCYWTDIYNDIELFSGCMDSGVITAIWLKFNSWIFELKFHCCRFQYDV
eukprot:458879_1